MSDSHALTLEQPSSPALRPQTLSFYDTVRARHSIRGFLPQSVPDAIIREVLEDAQQAPSNCNTQPWNTHVVSGGTRDKLSADLIAAIRARRFSPDFSFSTDAYSGSYAERVIEQGRARNEALGIPRDDVAGRMKASMQNYTFFNAPHVALLFMPSVGDNVRVAADVGMYGQTFLLALAARGLGGVSQTSIGLVADTVREVLGVSTDFKFLFAISFGYPDENRAESPKMPRISVTESVTFHR